MRRGAIRTVPAVIAVGMLLLASFGPVRASAEGIDAPLIDPLTGKQVKVRYEGLLHVVFFATWCPPCMDEMSRLADLEARWQDDGYRLLLIAVPTRHTVDRIREFVANRRPPGQVLFDESGLATAELLIRDVPTHILLDANGKELIRAFALDEGVIDRVHEALGR